MSLNHFVVGDWFLARRQMIMMMCFPLVVIETLLLGTNNKIQTHVIVHKS